MNASDISQPEQVASLAKTWVDQLLLAVGIQTNTDDPVYLSGIGILILCSAIVSLLAVRLVLNRYTTKWMFRTSGRWDASLHENKVFNRLCHLVPALIITPATFLLLPPDTAIYVVLMKLSKLYLLVVGLSIVFAVLNTIEDLYSQSKLARKASITGFIQIGKLVFSIIALLLFISILINKSPVLLVSGLTAIAAVLLLIFRDTILGFVAGIQIAANRMFNTGDWIEMHKYEVDGEILEIGLTNVKVQNWDKTISTLPTYALTNESVKNWRGMSESGGRRIKRSIHLDIHSIRLCDAAMLDKFAKITSISHYIEAKKQELATYHNDNHIDEQDLLNNRRLTNIGTFRAYVAAYLKNHPMVNQSMTNMVRHLQPTELGIPLEVYCFCSDKDWVAYERVQADIFDHLLAMLDVFELRAYQRDAGYVLGERVAH